MIPPEIAGMAFTRVETRILEMMSDGGPYTIQMLRPCLRDVELAQDIIVQQHISNIRKKIVISRLRICSGKEKGQLTFRLVSLLYTAPVIV